MEVRIGGRLIGRRVLRGDGLLSIIDLKYGRGVKVSAVDNEQLLIYGLAALREGSADQQVRLRTEPVQERRE